MKTLRKLLVASLALISGTLFAADEMAKPALDGYCPVCYVAGLCAYGMAFGKKFEADPTVFSVVDGKIYLNKDAAIGEKFSADKAAFIAKADAEWKKIEMAMKEEEMKK